MTARIIEETVLAHIKVGTRWRSSLKHCATSRNVAGSLLGGVVEMTILPTAKK